MSLDKLDIESAMCVMYLAGSSIRQVAAHYNCSFCRVHNVLKRNNVPRRKRALLTLEVEARIVELYSPSMSGKDVAERLGVSLSLVYNTLRKRGVATLGSGDRPDRLYAQSPLNETSVWELRTIALHCHNWAKLGRMFGVSANAAKCAVVGFTWKHVPMPSLQATG